ncbi:four helix bundle protein [Planctomicrobium sp. SH661]|uniref:four helix bundle protein n=1 Tax=Planctomicrobium sp. SH661 TaxID=3448124 RepID=UPI003F5C4732
MRDFRQFSVWRKSHELTLSVYRETAFFPSHEVYGLTSQLRRSSVSIAANIAEGCGRHSDADFARFLSLSAGSACENEYHLLLARDLEYLPADTHSALGDVVVEVRRMLAGLIKKRRFIHKLPQEQLSVLLKADR